MTRSLCLWRTTPRNGETTLRPWPLDSRSAPYPHGTLGWEQGRPHDGGGHRSQAGRHRTQRLRRDRSFLPSNRRGVGHLARTPRRPPRPRTVGRQPSQPALAARARFCRAIPMVELGKRARNGSIRQRRPAMDRRMGPPRRERPQLVQPHGDWRGTFTLARVQTQSTADVLPTHAGTPLGSPLLPLWSFDNSWESSAVWRSEGAVSWTHQRMRAGLHVLTLADQWWLEGWGAWTLQTEWPLHLTAGFETWQLEGSPNMPNEGLRWRVGVSHTLVMSPGRPTFAQPCCP